MPPEARHPPIVPCCRPKGPSLHVIGKCSAMLWQSAPRCIGPLDPVWRPSWEPSWGPDPLDLNLDLRIRIATSDPRSRTRGPSFVTSGDPFWDPVWDPILGPLWPSPCAGVAQGALLRPLIPRPIGYTWPWDGHEGGYREGHLWCLSILTFARARGPVCFGFHRYKHR